MKKRVLSMLLALVMALGLCVPAFATDEFEAEAPVVQEEEIPAAPEAPEAPAEETVSEPAAEEIIAEPAPVAAEPADEPEIAAAEKGKFTVGGEKSQIISIYMYDLLTHKLLGDPREVGVVPGAEIDILLQPGYAVREALYGYYTWYSPDEPPVPVNDEDVVSAYVSRIYVSDQGGSVTATVAEGPAMPETVPVTYEGDRAARFGNTSKAYKDDAQRNYVLFKPGYTVKISGGTVLWTEPVQDGAALEAVYTVDEGAKSVTVDFIKSSGKFVVTAPAGVVNWADLIDSSDPETWDTASWISNLLEINDIFPGMGIYLAISPEYELANLDEDLLLATGFQPLNSGEPARYYHIKTPDTGDLRLTVKAATDSIPFQLLGEKGAVHCDPDTSHTHPGSELTIYVKSGHYVEPADCDLEFLGENDEDGCVAYRVHVSPAAENVTITAGKATGKLVVDTESTAFRAAVMENSSVRMSDPTLGLAPGTTVIVTVANGYAVEFEGTVDPQGSYRWIQNDPDSEFYGQIVRDYWCTAPASGDVVAKIVPGETVGFIPVEIVNPENALIYASCQGGAEPGQTDIVELENGYSLSVTNGEILEHGAWVWSATGDITVYYAIKAPDKGTMTLTVVGGAEKYKAVPISYVDDYDAIETKDAKYALAGDVFSLYLKEGYTAEVEGADYFPGFDYVLVSEDAEAVTVIAKPIVKDATLTIQGETDAVVPDSDADVKADIGMTDDTVLLSDGSVLKDGTGHILVSADYTVSAVSDAVVWFHDAWISDADDTMGYYDYDVLATGKNPVVKVEKGEGIGRFVTATVVNKDGADFRFTSTDSILQANGTYLLSTLGYVYMTVENGYALDVDGAAYWNTVTDESTGDVVQIYELDKGTESITVTVVKAGWQWKTDGWHYYGGGREIKGDWVLDGGETYYINDKGVMVTGWKSVNGKWYYFKKNGAMISNDWLNDGGKWYLLGSDGAMLTGLQEVKLGRKDDGLYYFNEEHDGTYGCVLTGFQGADGATYYLNPKHDGTYGRAYKDGTFKIEGAYYTFDSEGKCLGWYM